MYEGIHRLLDESYVSGDSWMYPYHRTPMGNPCISPREHNKYHGYTARGTPNCPLNVEMELLRNRSNHPSLAQHKVEPAKVRVSWSLDTFFGGRKCFFVEVLGDVEWNNLPVRFIPINVYTLGCPPSQ